MDIGKTVSQTACASLSKTSVLYNVLTNGINDNTVAVSLSGTYSSVTTGTGEGGVKITFKNTKVVVKP